MNKLKHLSHLLNEVSAPKSPDEKRFKDKHVTVKTPDANGNKDDVFQATNVKSVRDDPKEKSHGYAPGKDEEVYEGNEANLNAIKSASEKSKLNHFLKTRKDNKARAAIKYGKKKDKEESSNDMEEGYVSHAQRKAVWATRKDGGKGHPDNKKKMKEEFQSEEQSTPTPKHDDPRWELYAQDKDKKYTCHHIPRSHAKPGEPRFKHTLKNKVIISNSKYYPDEMKDQMKESTQQVDEVLKPSMGVKAYIDDFIKSDDPRFKGASKKDRIKRALAAYYSAKGTQKEETELSEVKAPTGDLKKACWKGYRAVGLKMKNGKKVPNCVPEEVDLEEAKQHKRIIDHANTILSGVKGKGRIDTVRRSDSSSKEKSKNPHYVANFSNYGDKGKISKTLTSAGYKILGHDRIGGSNLVRFTKEDVNDLAESERSGSEYNKIHKATLKHVDNIKKALVDHKEKSQSLQMPSKYNADGTVTSYRPKKDDKHITWYHVDDLKQIHNTLQDIVHNLTKKLDYT